MESRGTLGISGCLFTSQVGTGHHCLSWQLHTPYPSKTMARPDTISKLHLFTATCKESYLKPSQTLKCFKLWCWVHPHSSFILHSSLRIKICTSKTPLFVAVICGHCMATYCGTMCPSLQAPDERWNFKKKFQQKYRLIANPENPVLRIESLARTSRHTRLLDEYQNQIQVWTLPIHDSSSGVWNEINVYRWWGYNWGLGDMFYEVDHLFVHPISS